MDGVDGGGQTLKLRFPSDPQYCATVRRDVMQFAQRYDVNAADLHDFVFAIGEALANAIEHSGADAEIEILCRIDGEKIIATVVDGGPGFHVKTPFHPQLPGPLVKRGRGLPIMRRCTDIFAVHSVPGKGTAVVLGRYLHRPRGRRGPEEFASAS